jgi:hypothetical protein
LWIGGRKCNTRSILKQILFGDHEVHILMLSLLHYNRPLTRHPAPYVALPLLSKKAALTGGPTAPSQRHSALPPPNPTLILPLSPPRTSLSSSRHRRSHLRSLILLEPPQQLPSQQSAAMPSACDRPECHPRDLASVPLLLLLRRRRQWLL